jgi:NAD-reducing hydrogenase small subunit
MTTLEAPTTPATPTTPAKPSRKLRIATVWLGGCSGCHMSFLDLDEKLLAVAAAADLVYSPIADVKEFPHDVDVTLVEGAIANEDHLELIHQVRERSRLLVALGDCAITGNVTALRNVLNVKDVLNAVYAERASAQPQVPEYKGIVPTLLPRVEPLHRYVTVDAYLPGCPPTVETIWNAVSALLRGEPATGTGPAPKFG